MALRTTHIHDVDELKGVAISERVKMPESEVNGRRGSFDEVKQGLDGKMACGEADRCLSCGLICHRTFFPSSSFNTLSCIKKPDSMPTR